MKKPLKQIKLFKTVMFECKRQWNYVGKKSLEKKKDKQRKAKSKKKKMRKEKEK